jgi:hypothetical protein
MDWKIFTPRETLIMAGSALVSFIILVWLLDISVGISIAITVFFVVIAIAIRAWKIRNGYVVR